MSKKNLVLKKTIVARALTVAFGASVLAVGINQTAMAQTNATGTLFGTVAQGLGNAVTIQNKDTNATRTVNLDASGKFQVTALPTGNYRVTLLKSGAVVRTLDVEVILGQGVDASFANVQTVEVAARRNRIDVSNTNNGATYTAKELNKLPITPNVASIIQLAPNTTRGDSRYGGGNAPSFGGASASENAFYINGFPVTNVLLQVGASELPFNSIAQAQILSGGYSAEFGRSTGGVVNITTKSGTNTWEVGGSANYTPQNLRAKGKSIYYPRTGAPENAGTDGKLFSYSGSDRTDSYTLNAFVGGPIIKDKLFIFANLEQIKSTQEFARLSSASSAAAQSGWNESDNKTTRALVKVDWFINDDHRLEYTNIVDKPESRRRYYGFDYNTLQRNNVQAGGDYYVNSGPNPVAAATGAVVNIFKYTGNLTDSLVLTGLYGNSTTNHTRIPAGYNPSIFQTTSSPSTRVPGVTYPTVQRTTGNLLAPGAVDDQIVYRVDLEYKTSTSNTVRIGLDHDDISSVAGNTRAGGGRWVYGRVANPLTSRIVPSAQPTATGGGFGVNGYYVERSLFSTLTTPSVKQSAQYIEDRYQITPKVLITGGIRNEQFTNYNGDGDAYVSQKTQIAPRLGASWDVDGDSSFKVFGNAGRYHLQLPTNVAVRGAGSTLNTREFFTYTGVDQATGAPTGLVPISGVTSANNEFGQAKDARTVAATNLDSHYQDEIAIGFEKAFSPSINFGAKFTYRTLKSTIDDFCDGRPFLEYAARNNIDVSNYPGFNCALFNPGKANEFLFDYGDGKLTPVRLTAAELGYPKVDRKYTAIDLFLEHPLRSGWYGKVNYTWSRSKGNTEGQLLSDIGQADVATTQSFDYPEISIGSNGKLPNDRTHQIKAYGFYEISPQLIVGGNFLAASGRPRNCIGNFPDQSNEAAAYGSAFFYCRDVATPRGSQGKLPWDVRLDANLSYRPAVIKGLNLKLDVFNVFNKQTIQNVDEVYNSDVGVVSSTFGQIVSYTAPRSFRLTAEYSYKF